MSPKYFSCALSETCRTKCLYSALVIGSARPRPAFIEFISFPRQAADFLVYPWKSIPSTSFPNWDDFVYTLLKSGSEPIPHALY